MKFKHQLMLGSALIVGAISSSAAAQTRPTNAVAATTNTIEELVVTAEKREQNLQDVPIAISAFTDKQRDIVGIQSIQDMTNFTPGLQYSTSTDRVSLRGLGRLTNVLSADASVANYADGVYETFAVRAGASTLFTDRVEVLRGPQGTLYGRNSIAGALNIISKRPTEDWYAEARVGYANYEHSDVEFAVSGPTAIPGWKFRLAAQWEDQEQGWIKNTVPNRASEGNVLNTLYIEGQIEGKFGDNLEMWSKFGYTNWKNGAGGPGSQSGGWTPNIYSADPAHPNQVLPNISAGNPNGGNGFNIIEFPQASTNINAGFGCSGLATNVISANGPGIAGCVNASHSSPWLKNSPISYQVRLPNAYTVASHWTYHTPDFDVKYIVGGVRYWYHLNGSVPNGSADSPITQFTAGATTFYPQESFDYQERNGFISHELNLVSTTDKPLQWIVGAYYFDQNYTQPVSTEEEPAQKQWFSVPPFGVCLSGTIPNATSVACPTGIGRRFDNRPAVEDISYATYGQLTYKFDPTLTLTGGLRYSHDEKRGTESVRLLCFGLPACLSGLPPEIFAAPLDLTGVTTVVAGGTGVGIDQIPQGVTGGTSYNPATGFATRHYDASWEAVTGTAKVDWQPDDNTLLYGSYSRGYRSGGFNIGIFTVLSFKPFSDKETVDAFEVGFKKNWPNNLQTNVALYHYEYNNLQIPITEIQGGSGALVSTSTTAFYNVPKSRSQGIELETIWQPIQDLQLIFNYSLIDAKVITGQAVDIVDPTAVQQGAKPIHTLAQCQAGGAAVAGDCATDDPTNGLPGGGFQRQQSLAGNDLPNAPRNKLAFAGNYTWRFAAGSLTGNLSYSWRDKAYGTVFTRWYTEAPSWDQWDARAIWTSKDNHYELIGYIKNIFDKIGYDQGAIASRINGAFSNVYGPNPAGLTCSPIVTGSGNLAAGQLGTVNCVQGIQKTFYTTPPRTFGVDLRYKF
ncbi:TonB-dependent receptor [Phenylobacterium sp.]|uniref:TonB-dependent receptor n=1 Tax=Phenylobacterium sp. TaxID=1871053 RepID=UPI002C093A99|nr:TonB-dependent receptor [Phenylobacterium sp.]HLZ77310.1 TonB-dependent receptor [Phenylobacterium sp.]